MRIEFLATGRQNARKTPASVYFDWGAYQLEIAPHMTLFLTSIIHLARLVYPIK